MVKSVSPRASSLGLLLGKTLVWREQGMLARRERVCRDCSCTGALLPPARKESPLSSLGVEVRETLSPQTLARHRVRRKACLYLVLRREYTRGLTAPEVQDRTEARRWREGRASLPSSTLASMAGRKVSKKTRKIVIMVRVSCSSSLRWQLALLLFELLARGVVLLLATAWPMALTWSRMAV